MGKLASGPFAICSLLLAALLAGLLTSDEAVRPVVRLGSQPAVAAGANTASNIQFSIKDQTRLYARVLSSASNERD